MKHTRKAREREREKVLFFEGRRMQANKQHQLQPDVTAKQQIQGEKPEQYHSIG